MDFNIESSMNLNINKIFIDPRFQINYSSYYIKGITLLYGADITEWRIIDSELLRINDMEDFRRGMACVIEFEDGSMKNIFIDTNDGNNIHERFYSWSDLYAKINLADNDEAKEKVLGIGPSFSVRLWNPVKTIWMGLRYYSIARGKSYCISFKDYLLNYWYTYWRRLDYSWYEKHDYEEDDDYVFALSTLWYDPLTYETTNKMRGVFARCCQKMFTKFEGGFFYIANPIVIKQFPKYKEYLEQYGDILIKKRIGMKEYITKQRKSAVVFNTPSVSGCHGWKLGEYLAMGKCFISMPLNNVMPGNFTDWEQCLFVRNEEELCNAVSTLRDDSNKRRELKHGARKYFEKYLAPEVVISRIIDKAAKQ